MPKHNVVKDTIHKGRHYKPGEKITLTEDEAKSTEERGLTEAPVDKKKGETK